MTTECEYCRGLDQCPLCAIDNERLVKDNAALIADVERLQNDYKEVEKERDQAQVVLAAWKSDMAERLQAACANVAKEVLLSMTGAAPGPDHCVHGRPAFRGCEECIDLVSDLTAQIASIAIERDQARSNAVHLAAGLSQALARVAELEEWKSRGWYDRESILEERRRTAAAVEALKKYGQHTSKCVKTAYKTEYQHLYKCDCGLEDLLDGSKS